MDSFEFEANEIAVDAFGNGMPNLPVVVYLPNFQILFIFTYLFLLWIPIDLLKLN